MTRKQFMSGASAAVAGLTFPSFASDKRPFKAALLAGKSFFGGASASALKAKLCAGGFNVALVDVQDGVVYPSHPEIATKNSMSAQKASAHIRDWRESGIEVVPLLDFCTARDSWLGVYDRMVCSKPYDALVRDLIRDAHTIFASPKFIHIGFSDEGRSQHPQGSYAVMRQGDLWMRYLARTSSWVKETGARTWAWFDYPWGMKDFLQDCPRDIVYSNFKRLSDKRIFNRFSQVVKAGCDAVPFLHADSDADALAKLSEKRVLGIIKEVTA